ncbi:MAG: helix-turn-helix transcriptional regulator [candidate division WOR-3 bacterium]
MNKYEARLKILSQSITFLKKIYPSEKLHYWVDIKTNRIGVPHRLWTLRVSLNMSEEEFARTIGLTLKDYQRFECIGAEVPEFVIKRVCAKFGIDKNWLKVL